MSPSSLLRQHAAPSTAEVEARGAPSATKRLKSSLAAYFHHKDRSSRPSKPSGGAKEAVSLPVSRCATLESDSGSLHLAKSRSRSSLDPSPVVGNFGTFSSWVRDEGAATGSLASDPDSGEEGASDSEFAGEDADEEDSPVETASSATSTQRDQRAAAYPAPPLVGPNTRTKASGALDRRAPPNARQGLPSFAQDNQANSRRLFASGEAPERSRRSSSLKGKEPLKGAGRSGDADTQDEEEERLSRGGSEFGDSGLSDGEADVISRGEGGRTAKVVEGFPSRSEEADVNGRGRREHRRSGLPAERPRLTSASRRSSSRSRSSSAPATPRAAFPPLLSPLAPAAPPSETLPTPRLSSNDQLHPARLSPSSSHQATQPPPQSSASTISLAPYPPVASSHSSRAGHSSSYPTPQPRGHPVGLPARSITLPVSSISTPPSPVPLPFHRLSGARLISSQRYAEPYHWAALRDFTLGSYPSGRTVDSSSTHYTMPGHYARHSSTSSAGFAIPMARAASAGAPGSSSGAAPSAYAGSAGGFGPVNGSSGGGTGGLGGSTPGGISGAASSIAPSPSPVTGTPLTPGHSGIEIFLDSPDLVLRSIAGNEGSGDPAVLSGEVQLTLTETTSLKDISIVLRGVCKVDYHDAATGGRRHHCEHPLFYHDQSFLPPPVDPAHPHSHTLKSGSHRFPISIKLPTTLPASLRTYSGTGIIYYKLKAMATRSVGALGGLLSGGGKWEAKRLLRVARSFEPEAMEWIQTLEIDNTWPGKISYEITLPHKAFAAGSTIPVSLKFSPLMKGVRIASLTTTIKEQAVLSGKGTSTHTETRDVISCRHEFVRPGAASPHQSTSQHRAESSGTSSNNSGPRRNLSHSDMNILASRLQAVQTGVTPRLPASYTRSGPSSVGPRPHPPRAQSSSSGEQLLGAGANGEHVDPGTLQEIAEDLSLSEDVDAVIDVDVPSWTTPTSTIAPIQVTHKIKWSAYIKNPDGHTSELRCALPIHILAPHLAEEARLASSGIRNLLFGPSGALAPSDFQQADLPSYSEHVRDRVAPLDTTSIYPMPTGFIQAPWVNALDSTVATPMHSPPPSRPPSPGPSNRVVALPTGSRSGYQTPAYGSSLHDGHRVAWADSELLRTLDDDVTERPLFIRQDSSQSSSRSASAPNSRPGSRPPSRPSSPTFGHAQLPDMPSPGASAPSPEAGLPMNAPPPAPSFFNLHLPKPLRALTPMSRSSAATPPTAAPPQQTVSSAAPHHASLHARLAGIASARAAYSSGAQSPGARPGILSTSSSTNDLRLMPGGYSADEGGSGGSSAHHSGGPSLSSSPTQGLDPDDPMSRVPSYTVASRGALGGGPVPLSSFIGLPSYEESSSAYSYSNRPATVSLTQPAQQGAVPSPPTAGPITRTTSA